MMKRVIVSLIFLFMAGAAHAQGSSPVNVLTLLPQTSPETDYTKAINSALASGKTVYLPNTGKPYVVSGAIEFKVDGTGLLGQPGTTIAFTTSQTIFRILASHITFKDITFDGTALGAKARPEAYCLKPDFQWSGGGMHYGGPTFIQPGCDNAQITNLHYDFDSSTAFTVQARGVTIANSHFNNNVGFGMVADNGSFDFHFLGNTVTSNGLEGAAVKHGAQDGEIRNNHVTGSADNCISISGDHVMVTNNDLEECLCHGIGVYGDQNTISNNKIINNSQVNNPSARAVQEWNGVKAIYHSPGYDTKPYYGIKVIGANGGHGQGNTISNNTITDTQPQPTQRGLFVTPGMNNSVETNSIGRQVM